MFITCFILCLGRFVVWIWRDVRGGLGRGRGRLYRYFVSFGGLGEGGVVVDGVGIGV